MFSVCSGGTALNVKQLYVVTNGRFNLITTEQTHAVGNYIFLSFVLNVTSNCNIWMKSCYLLWRRRSYRWQTCAPLFLSVGDVRGGVHGHRGQSRNGDGYSPLPAWSSPLVLCNNSQRECYLATYLPVHRSIQHKSVLVKTEPLTGYGVTTYNNTKESIY